ncbi:UNVERIFIED_CONTAM: hypothetical protein FKN15_060571 [Acipenser sinensis]
MADSISGRDTDTDSETSDLEKDRPSGPSSTTPPKKKSAEYSDETSPTEKGDDAVAPGEGYQYVWDILPSIGPTLGDPQCLTYSYSSHVHTVRDFNSGLIGALLVCKANTLKADGSQKDMQEFVLLFSVFDEAQSWYGEADMFRERIQNTRKTVKKQYHSINGFVNSTLTGLKMCQKKKAHWHLIGMGTAPEIHSVRFHGHTLLVQNHRKVSFDMTPMTFATAQLTAVNTGRFLISCQIHAHQHDGTFRKRTPKNGPDRGIMGPVLRGETGDEFQITFKNLARHPFNIYPHGLTSVQPFVAKPSLEGKDLKKLAIQPNETFTYSWKITLEDGPTKSDPRCLTRFYHSSLDPVRDAAAGLVGPLVICTVNTLNSLGKVVQSDKERYLLFSIFDENKSWYINENLEKYCGTPSSVDPADPAFYNSNVMYSRMHFYNSLFFCGCILKIFMGNVDGSGTKENTLSPPIIAQYIRVLPLSYSNRPTLRMELIGCDLNSCSMPLGMERGLIQDNHISASSFHENWYSSWKPSLARLNLKMTYNAWRPKANNPHEWLKVDFGEVKRITGIITQGAKRLMMPMFVTEFTISFSNDGVTWTAVLEKQVPRVQVFQGNTDYNTEALNTFQPPIFSRYIRIHPKGWQNEIALRVEFLGCDTQQ